MADAFVEHGALELRDRAPLVVAGEAERPVVRLPVVDRVGLLGEAVVQEPPDKVEPGATLEDLFPEVRRRAGTRDRGVAGAVVLAAVERQEAGVRPVEFGRHVHFLVRDDEVHERTATEREQRLPLGPPVLRVLLETRGEVLREVGFQLDRRHRDAVDEQHQVDAVRVARRVHDLPHHPQPVRGEALRGLRIQRRGRPRLEQRELRVQHPHRRLQHVERAAAVHRVGRRRRDDPVEDLPAALIAGCLGGARLHELLQLLRLRRLEPGKHVGAEERPFTVVAGVVG